MLGCWHASNSFRYSIIVFEGVGMHTSMTVLQLPCTLYITITLILSYIVCTLDHMAGHSDCVHEELHGVISDT